MKGQAKEGRLHLKRSHVAPDFNDLTYMQFDVAKSHPLRNVFHDRLGSLPMYGKTDAGRSASSSGRQALARGHTWYFLYM